EMLVLFEAFQDIYTGHVRQIEVEQDQQRAVFVDEAGAIGAEQKRGCARAVRKRHDLAMDSRPTEVLLDEARVAFIVFDHRNNNWIFGHVIISLTGWCHVLGNVTLNTVPWLGSLSTLIDPPRRRTSVRA